MEEAKRQRGRPRKNISVSEENESPMIKHFIALKNAQHAYYQRNKDKFAESRRLKIIERTGEEPRLGRPPKSKKIEA